MYIYTRIYLYEHFQWHTLAPSLCLLPILLLKLQRFRERRSIVRWRMLQRRSDDRIWWGCSSPPRKSARIVCKHSGWWC